jgi:hypothetical protein
MRQTTIEKAVQPKAPPTVNPLEGFAGKAHALEDSPPDKAKAMTIDALRTLADALAALPHQPLTPGMAADRVRNEADKLEAMPKTAPGEVEPVRQSVILSAQALAEYERSLGVMDQSDLLDAKNAAKAIDPKKTVADQTNALAQALSIISDVIIEAGELARKPGRAAIIERSPTGATGTASTAAAPERPTPTLDLLHQLAVGQDVSKTSRALLDALALDLQSLPKQTSEVQRAIFQLHRSSERLGRLVSPLGAPLIVREGLVAAASALESLAGTPAEKVLIASALRAAQSIDPRTPIDLQRAALQDAFRATADALVLVREA